MQCSYWLEEKEEEEGCWREGGREVQVVCAAGSAGSFYTRYTLADSAGFATYRKVARSPTSSRGFFNDSPFDKFKNTSMK